MKAIIFANGDLGQHRSLRTLIDESDFFIAADGGANHCFRLNITPDILIGDLDSIAPDILEHFSKSQVAISRYPVEKDAADLEIALDLARDKGAQSIVLAGVLGGRWDMSLGNILLAASYKYKELYITLLGPDCLMQILHPDAPHQLTSEAGTRVSLLPIHGDAHGVNLQGFLYPLTNQTISSGSSRGISNSIVKEKATVQLSKGTLLCIQSHEKEKKNHALSSNSHM